MDSSTPIVQDLPTTNDGKIYIYLGIAYDTTHMELHIWHPIYYHDGTNVRLWRGKQSILPPGGTAGQVLGKLSGSDYDFGWFTPSGGGGAESDPIFSASPAAGISQNDIDNWDGKADASSVPTKTSDLTNDSGYITGMYIASYGNSTYAEVLAAFQANKIVYCRASSNANPASGSQNRMAFLAYVNDSTTPTEFEFQYYRSVATHSDAQQGDQVFVYKLKSASGWEVSTREAYTKIVTGTGLTSSYSNGVLTISLDS